jgi:Dockerin type I domain
MGEGTPRSGFVRAVCLLACFGTLAVSSGCFMQPAGRGSTSDRELPTDNNTSSHDTATDDAVISEPTVEEPIRAPGDDVVDELVAEPIDDPNLVPIEEFGDLNADGVIDDDDVAAFSTAFGNFTDDALTEAADFDGDGRVTLVDFQMYLTMTGSQQDQ